MFAQNEVLLRISIQSYTKAQSELLVPDPYQRLVTKRLPGYNQRLFVSLTEYTNFEKKKFFRNEMLMWVILGVWDEQLTVKANVLSRD